MDSTPGSGTTMTFDLPLTVGSIADRDLGSAVFAGPLADRRTRPPRDEAERDGSLILLAEDHPVNRTVIVQQLELVGFQVDVAEDGEAAFERFVSGRYGLVLTDLNMPRMDGYELALAIRRHERRQGLAAIPILALSANVMQGEPERTKAVGMNDFMAKPTTVPFLAGKLRQWLPTLTWDAPPAADEVSVQPGDSVVDVASLELLTGGDEALGRAVLGDFVDSTRVDLQLLLAATDGQRAADVRRSAHRIRGASLTVGARSIARLAQQLETSTAGDSELDWNAVADLAGRLGQALETTVARSDLGRAPSAS